MCLRDCNLANVEAPYSEWRAVELHGCRLTGLDLRDSSGRHVLFADCRADLVSLRSARLEGAVFRDCLLTGADLSGADLRGARFERCDLTEVELREARLEGAVLRRLPARERARRARAARGEDALGRRRRARAGVRRRARDRADRVKLLVIGGTVFLGRAVVAAALARDHAVTIFHRGFHNPELFPEAEHLLGDRTRDLSALLGREWDAVIDTCGFEPEHVGAAAELLADRVGHYGFVSSGSVYPEWGDVLVTEDSPVFESDEREYGPLKAACERAAEAAMPGRVLAARAGVIVGPHENIGRLPRWLWRLAEGGEVLAPGPPDAPLQLIDARDLATWMLDMAESARGGAFNAISRPGSATWASCAARPWPSRAARRSCAGPIRRGSRRMRSRSRGTSCRLWPSPRAPRALRRWRRSVRRRPG